MGLTKYRLGDLLTKSEERNPDGQYGIEDVKGISINKCFIETKADMEGVALSRYYLVRPDYFAYVTVTSRNGERITIAHNKCDKAYLVSSSYVVFFVSRPDILHPDYLFMFFNRPEFDRYSRFNSWGSARETFAWEDMRDIEIELPSFPIQQKYVDAYNALLNNQLNYERSLDDLKLTCDSFIERLRHELPPMNISPLVEMSEKKNENNIYSVDDVRGISIEKTFIPTKANMDGVSLTPYLVVDTDEFAYVTVTSRNGGKISIALNHDSPCICSSSYIAFKILDKEKLLPSYLMLFLSRSEFDRYARFCSWGSARETFDWSEMQSVKIPIPTIDVQRSIASIYSAYKTRKTLNERLKTQLRDICPILIKGSLEEANV